MRTNITFSRSHPTRRFGRAAAQPMATVSPSLIADLKLFSLTFAGGFLFMSVFLA